MFYQVCQDLPRTGFNEMRSLTAPGHDFVVLEEIKDADALTIECFGCIRRKKYSKENGRVERVHGLKSYTQLKFTVAGARSLDGESGFSAWIMLLKTSAMFQITLLM